MGHDDALAILLAAGHLNVLGITTVAGNQTIDKVTSNALKILTVAGLTHIPVARGMAGPLLPTSRQKPDVHGPDFHGETGLDGPDLPEPAISPDRRHAVDFIIETIQAHDEVTLVPTGPRVENSQTRPSSSRSRSDSISVRLRSTASSTKPVTCLSPPLPQPAETSSKTAPMITKGAKVFTVGRTKIAINRT